MVKKYNYTLLVSSNPATGAINISDDGSTFSVEMDRPLHIPKEASNIYVEVLNAEIWWNIPNIKIGVNDQFKITHLAVDYTITIPQGLYDVNTLNAKLNVLIFNATGVEDLIELIPDTSESKIIIQYNFATTQVDFTIANSLREILGFNSSLVPLVPTTGQQFEIAPNVANFNQVNYFLIKAPTLLSRGLNFNSVYSGIIARVLINVAPNSQILYDPQNAYKISANELAGIDLTTLNFVLTDDQNRNVETQGEFWSMIFYIHYEV